MREGERLCGLDLVLDLLAHVVEPLLEDAAHDEEEADDDGRDDQERQLVLVASEVGASG